VATFEVALSGADDPRALPGAGAVVTFTLSGRGGTATVTARTDFLGVATARQALTLPPGEYALTIAAGRLGAFGSASTTVPYTIGRPPIRPGTG
jgi:hypothetical protein